MNNDSQQTIVERMLTTTPPTFSTLEAATIAADFFGIDAEAGPLVSERDQNFLLKTASGEHFVLKISNAAEQLQVIDFQNHALLHVAETDASLPLPRVLRTLDGQLHCSVESAGKPHYVRVLTWLEGNILADSVANTELSKRLGRLLARAGLALKGFDHPGSNPPSLWDMKRADELRDLLPHIEDPGLRHIIAQTLDRFTTQVQPTLLALRTQVIHNDMNPGNVLMDKTQPERISGLIDFGDLIKSPLIIDLAVAASYQLSEGDDPLAGALPLIAGYNSIRPLQNREMELLTDLVRTRLVTSLLIGSYRSVLFPENREYLLTSFQSARNSLLKLAELNNEDALKRIHTVCAKR